MATKTKTAAKTSSNMPAAWDARIKALVAGGVIPRDGHRVLLWGPRGTGKTTLPERLFGGDCESQTVTRGTYSDALIGSQSLAAPDGATVSQWVDGPAIRAMRRGCCLVLNEADQANDDLRGWLHAVLDDLEVARVTLPTGEVVRPAAGFCVFATTNTHPDEIAARDPALVDRFDYVIHASTPADGSLGDVPAELARYCERSYDSANNGVCAYSAHVTVRSVRALTKLAKTLGWSDAAALVFGDKGAEILAMASLGGEDAKE